MTNDALRVLATIWGLVALPMTGRAADVVVGRDPGERAALTINERSADAGAHTIAFSVKDPVIAPGARGGASDPVANGATAVVFSATDCQCRQLAPAPGVDPGWTAAPATGVPARYKWRDGVTGSTAQLRSGRLKLALRDGVTYGLDATPQGEVEVQLRLGSAGDRFCARFAAPDKPETHDSSTMYRARGIAAGTAACAVVPASCGPCAEPTSRIELVSSRSVNGFEVDYYRNLALPCSLSGYQTFAIAHRPETAATSARPLWVFMHGGGFGFFDASGTPVPDAQYMVEETLDDLLYSPAGGLASAGLVSLVANDPTDFRMLGVSMCDRDFYNGSGGLDLNNPRVLPDGSPVTTNGLLATKAAIDFARSRFATSKYFLHGGSAGSVGSYGLAWSLQLAGEPPAGVVADSGLLNQDWLLAVLAQGIACPAPGAAAVLTTPARIASVGARLDPAIADAANEPDRLVSSGRLTVPVMNVWVHGDPYYCGSRPMQCPLRDGTTAPLGSTDCMVEPLRAAIAAQGAGSRSANLPLCVDAGCGRHVPTRFNLGNTDPASPPDFNAAILSWVHARLAD